MLFIFELIIVANIADNITDNTNVNDIYIFVFVFSSSCFLVIRFFAGEVVVRFRRVPVVLVAMDLSPLQNQMK